MSADNWTVCPRCFDNAKRQANDARSAVMGLYGRIPVEEFDARRAELVEPTDGDFETFREDYEFYGASVGEIFASYKGDCSKCGLHVELKATKKFWPEAD